MARSLLMLLALALLTVACARQEQLAEMQVTNLRCEYLMDPVGLSEPQPVLSWELESPRRGEKQGAYRVLVASSRELLDQDQGDLWDSGRVEGDRSFSVRYEGQALTAGSQCCWKVQAWDGEGRATAFSPAARWSIGPLMPEDWQAQWIGMATAPYDTALRGPDGSRADGPPRPTCARNSPCRNRSSGRCSMPRPGGSSTSTSMAAG